MTRRQGDFERRDWCVGRMAVYDDWDGIAQERSRNWNTVVRQHQLATQVMRPRAAWQRHAGAWLIRVGGWLTRLGAEMTGHERPARVSVAGEI